MNPRFALKVEELKLKTGLLACAMAGALALPGGLLAQGQEGEDGASETDLGQLYRQARIEALAEQRAGDAPGIAPLPPERLHTPRLDSLRAWLRPEAAREEGEAVEPAPEPLPRIRERRVVRRLERAAFKKRFHDVRWAYLGANSRATLDTMQTRVLRARLQAHFGHPTRTVVDADTLEGRPASDYVQFEYWFVLNDGQDTPGEAVPLKIIDTGGPFDRGVVFAAPARFQDRLQELRAAFFEPVLGLSLRASYVDYYFHPETATWYRTGFDGRRFFVRPVDRRDITPGRRPTLERGP